MAEPVTSSFVPSYLLNQVPEADRQAVADQARANFFFGLLGTRGGFGRSLLGAQQAASGTVDQYITAAQNAAALAEAQRKAQLARDQQTARASALSQIAPNANVTPSMALGAPGAQGGPTAARAGMVGAPNPMANVPLSSRLLQAATDPRLLQIDPTFAGQLSTIAGQAKPTYERGQRIDPMRGGPQFVPNLAEGEEPIYDSRGNIIGTKNVAGAITALDQRERTKRVAEAAVTPEKVIDPDTGRTVYRSRAELLGLTNRPGQAQAQATGSAIAEMAPFEKDLAAQNVKSFETQREIARTGQNIVRNNTETLDLLDKGITGLAAEPRLAIARAFQAIGLGDGSVEATQGIVIDRGKAVLNTVKQLGAGVSISNSDRAFAEKLSGGDINLDEGTIRRVIRIENETAFQAAKKFNARVQTLAGKRDTFGGVPISDYIVSVPTLQYADEKAAADAKRRGILEKGDIVVINGRRAEVK